MPKGGGKGGKDNPGGKKKVTPGASSSNPAAASYAEGPFNLKQLEDICKTKYIGSGSNGTVYKTVDGEGKEYAIKLYKSHCRIQWQTEIDILTMVKNVEKPDESYFVELKGHGNSPGKFYLVLGYLPYTLQEKITALDCKQTLSIMSDIANGLKKLHDLNLVYGDLKPENVMLGQDMSAKLIDLGSAVRLGSSLEIGTPAYAPPEVRREGAGPQTVMKVEASFAYDIYSFGIVCLQLIMKSENPGTRNKDHMERGKNKLTYDKAHKCEEVKIVARANIYIEEKKKTIISDKLVCSDKVGQLLTVLAMDCVRDHEDRPKLDTVIAQVKKLLDIVSY